MSLVVCERVRASYVEISKLLRPPKERKNYLKWRGLCLRSQRCRFLHQTRCMRQESVGGSPNQCVLEKYKSSFDAPKSTNKLSQLPYVHSLGSTSKKVILHGYLGYRRDLSKNLVFATFVDPSNEAQVQVVSSLGNAADGFQTDETLKSAHEKLRSIRLYTPIALAGLVKPRSTGYRTIKGHTSSSSPLKDFEMVLHDLHILNDFPTNLIITPDAAFAPEQRHLQIRTDKHLSNALVLRSRIKAKLINLLHEIGFTEVETPLLFKSTSEGAREFIVPTRHKGLAYALPQSPQQLKQILMASGIPKYYQFAKCFRDEDLRADRQPEFTQLDLELAFADADDVIALVERLVRKTWKSQLEIELPKPFPRSTYEQAMSKYGSDKPDLRIPIPPFARIDYLLPADLISMITPLKNPIVEAMVLPLDHPPNEARGFIGNFLDSVDGKQFLENPHGGPGIFIYDPSKPLQGLSAFGFEAVEHIEKYMDLKDGHLIVLQARLDAPLNGGSTPLGKLRTAIYKAAVSQKLLEPPSWTDFQPLWVTDFPLFSPSEASEPGQGGNAGFASTHHPFTSPKTAADVDLLLTSPTKAIGDHYDLVINGEEIGGGSRRIHHAKMQEFVLRDILKMDETRIAEFSHLLEALQTGCPPHAGIALGFDRLVAMVHSSRSLRKTSLRDVIAFPKTGKGEDLMVKSPGLMSEETLETYHLKLRD